MISNPPSTRPRWIIFDAADTLLRPEPSVAAVYQRIAAAHGRQIERDVIRQRFAPAIRKHFADEISNETIDRERWQSLVFEVLQTDNASIFDELWEHFARPDSWRLYEDVEPTWRKLVELNFQLAIASNFDARLLGILSELLPAAQHIFISSALGFRKPSVKFFEAIQQELTCEPAELLLVGDSEHADFEGANRAGWQAIHLVRDKIDTALPQITTLAALPTLLGN